MNERIKDLAILCATQLDWDLPSDPTNYTFSSTGLEKFAELVVAAEREAVAAAEREACAKLVLATPEPDTRAIHCTVKCPKCSHYFPAPLRADMRRLIKDDHREAIVNAIRARGDK